MMPVWHGYQQADPNYGPAFIEMTKARPHRTRGEFVLNEDMALRDLPDEESIFKDIHFRKPWLKNRSSNNLVMLMKRFWKAANRIEELESLNDKFSKFASVSLIDDMINREIADFDAFASIFEQ
jgi:hypothetical protein